MEYRRFAPGESFVSTAEYHADRERAPHLEQPIHQWRLTTAAEMVHFWERMGTHMPPPVIMDLGCGDGGLLSLLQQRFAAEGVDVRLSGVDFQPSNAAGWGERGVVARAGNFDRDFNDLVPFGTDLIVMTEVLEHLEEPYEMLEKIRALGAAVVCSSPYREGPGNIDGSHNWAWDIPGYMEMLWKCGFESKRFANDGFFQVHLALPRTVSDGE